MTQRPTRYQVRIQTQSTERLNLANHIVKHADKDWVDDFIHNVIELDWAQELFYYNTETLLKWAKELGYPYERVHTIRKARGGERELLTTLGEIQTLAGRAKGIYLNDRSAMTADELLPVLDRIFDLSYTARSEYEPVEEDK